jgi:hypothetical protein
VACAAAERGGEVFDEESAEDIPLRWR